MTNNLPEFAPFAVLTWHVCSPWQDLDRIVRALPAGQDRYTVLDILASPLVPDADKMWVVANSPETPRSTLPGIMARVGAGVPKPDAMAGRVDHKTLHDLRVVHSHLDCGHWWSFSRHCVDLVAHLGLRTAEQENQRQVAIATDEIYKWLNQ